MWKGGSRWLSRRACWKSVSDSRNGANGGRECVTTKWAKRTCRCVRRVDVIEFGQVNAGPSGGGRRTGHVCRRRTRSGNKRRKNWRRKVWKNFRGIIKSPSFCILRVLTHDAPPVGPHLPGPVHVCSCTSTQRQPLKCVGSKTSASLSFQK